MQVSTPNSRFTSFVTRSAVTYVVAHVADGETSAGTARLWLVSKTHYHAVFDSSEFKALLPNTDKIQVRPALFRMFEG